MHRQRLRVSLGGHLVTEAEVPDESGGRIALGVSKGVLEVRNLRVRRRNRHTPTQPLKAQFPDVVALDTPGVTIRLSSVLPRPNYTAGAMARKVQGVVSLEAIVEADGSTQRLRVVRSLDDELDLMAVDAVRKWRFRRRGATAGRSRPSWTSSCRSRCGESVAIIGVYPPADGRSFNGRTRGSGPRYRGSNPCLPANRLTTLQVLLLHRFDAFDSAVFFVARTERRPGGAATRHELSALALAKVSRSHTGFAPRAIGCRLRPRPALVCAGGPRGRSDARQRSQPASQDTSRLSRYNRTVSASKIFSVTGVMSRIHWTGV